MTLKLFLNVNVVYTNHYNSYSLQAQAWLRGNLHLQENYKHLELAFYGGKYFVSFPAFPSIVMLPFVLLFGTSTPDFLISQIFILLGALYAYKIADNLVKDKLKAMFLTLFLFLGNNIVTIGIWPGVWFIAQNMAFAFMLMSLYYALTKKTSDTMWSLLFLVCSAGCRPFQLINLFVIGYLIYIRYKKQKVEIFKPIVIGKEILSNGIPALVLGIFYMLLNFLRFGSVFEFGHTYLPEFQMSEYGQFNFAYLAENLKNTLFRLPSISDSRISFPEFDGVAFWIVNPIVITFLFYFLLQFLYKNSMKTSEKVTIFLVILVSILQIIFLCLHKTMGGHHFGNRYTVDLLPCIFLGIVVIIKNIVSQEILLVNAPLMVWGMIINFVGTAEFFNKYSSLVR